MGVPTGTPLARPPLIEAISEDPILCRTKLIAEAWDCGPLMQVSPGRRHCRDGWCGESRVKWNFTDAAMLPQLQVGSFPHYGGRWAEWNGRFRDTVRAFVKVSGSCKI